MHNSAEKGQIPVAIVARPVPATVLIVMLQGEESVTRVILGTPLMHQVNARPVGPIVLIALMQGQEIVTNVTTGSTIHYNTMVNPRARLKQWLRLRMSQTPAAVEPGMR